MWNPGSSFSNYDAQIPRLSKNDVIGRELRFADGYRPAVADTTIDTLIQDYTSITLEETNKRSQMLKRVDNKYVLNVEQLQWFVDAMRKEFAVLQIEGLSAFRYASCYFDENFCSYYDHHRGTRRRFKIRKRHYIDSGEIFFEVKLKEKRGLTSKSRIPCDTFIDTELSDANLEMLESFYHETYGRPFSLTLKPALLVNYRRYTFVSLVGGERITVDCDLCFDPLTGSSVDVGSNFIIVETKSANGRGIADVLLKNAGIRREKYLSKYCIGAILTGSVSRSNYFRTHLKRIAASKAG